MVTAPKGSLEGSLLELYEISGEKDWLQWFALFPTLPHPFVYTLTHIHTHTKAHTQNKSNPFEPVYCGDETRSAVALALGLEEAELPTLSK